MTKHVYKMECVTNLHVGSGDVNYNIIDEEVERDPVTNYPMIHASGVKGALREHFENKKDKAEIDYIFGSPATGMSITAGAYKFLDAYLFSRPMRVSGSEQIASLPVVTVESVNRYLGMLSALGCNPYGVERIDNVDFNGKEFLCTEAGVSVEGEPTRVISPQCRKQLEALEKDILGTNYAIVRDFAAYDLPVIARNHLDNGVSKNLWYEEYVPYSSVFYMVVMTPDGEDMALELDGQIVQFGGNASIGCGFTKLTKLV